MAKRPMCLLCFLIVLSLGALELMGIPLIRGNPLPLNVQEQIEAHPGSMICGEVEQYENTEFSQSVYLFVRSFLEGTVWIQKRKKRRK